MKFIFIIAFLAAAGHTEANGLRHLQAADECPVPGEGPCTMNILPVACGESSCRYDNICLAESAGFVEATDCCPAAAEGTICTAEFAPVACGVNQCQYSNLCGGTSSGFDPLDCCPISSEDVSCTAEFVPVNCGDNACQYSNQCNANAAGFTEDDCGDSPGQLPAAICPTPDEDVACTLEFMPVTCGENCEYSNQCSATAAGFAEDDCAAEELLPGEGDICPTPSEDVACTLEFMPVTCGENSCEYSNQCSADAAGFIVDDCAGAEQLPLEEECPTAGADVACSLEFMPVTCGENSCEYSNQCSADAAGFTVNDCDATEQIPLEGECPTAGEGIICPMNFAPVICGPEMCEYSNLCSGTSSGFNATDCCPVSSADVACTDDFMPMVCGDNNCEYSNQCAADAAGFTDADCGAMEQLLEGGETCPTPDGDTMCTMEFMPVTCGDDMCEYSNLCGGTSSGFDETDCCPAPSTDVPCTAEYMPVICGDNGCEYGNQCGANAAGFIEDDCTTAEELPAENLCPTPDEGTMCTMEFMPVTCGDDMCEYSNLCGGTSSGFDVKECCPAVSADVPCTAEYMPVKCGQLGCEYGNQCGADSAGFTEADCSAADQGTPTTLSNTAEEGATTTSLESTSAPTETAGADGAVTTSTDATSAPTETVESTTREISSTSKVTTIASLATALASFAALAAMA